MTDVPLYRTTSYAVRPDTTTRRAAHPARTGRSAPQPMARRLPILRIGECASDPSN
jgi:hypothetical protein